MFEYLYEMHILMINYSERITCIMEIKNKSLFVFRTTLLEKTYQWFPFSWINILKRNSDIFRTWDKEIFIYCHIYLNVRHILFSFFAESSSRSDALIRQSNTKTTHNTVKPYLTGINLEVFKVLKLKAIWNAVTSCIYNKFLLISYHVIMSKMCYLGKPNVCSERPQNRKIVHYSVFVIN